jgi:hypothetical protein
MESAGGSTIYPALSGGFKFWNFMGHFLEPKYFSGTNLKYTVKIYLQIERKRTTAWL